MQSCSKPTIACTCFSLGYTYIYAEASTSKLAAQVMSFAVKECPRRTRQMEQAKDIRNQKKPNLYYWGLHWRDDALLHQYSRFRSGLKRLLSCPFRPNREPK